MKFLVIGSKTDKGFGAAMNRAFDCDFISSKDKDVDMNDVDEVRKIDFEKYDVVVVFERVGMFKKVSISNTIFEEFVSKNLNKRVIVIDNEKQRPAPTAHDRKAESIALESLADYVNDLHMRSVRADAEFNTKFTYISAINLEKQERTLDNFEATPIKEVINAIKWIMSNNMDIYKLEMKPKKLEL